jgi:hypothetical protein
VRELPALRYPSLGFDPAPGDCWALGRLSRHADRVADDLSGLTEGLARLRGVEGSWRGTAAAEFTRALDDLPRSISASRRAFRVTAVSLLTYRDALLDLQAEARRAERDAEDALHRLHAQSATSSAVELARQDLEAARAWGHRIQSRAEVEARAAEQAVRRTTEFAPAVPGLLQRLNSGVGDWVRDNPELFTVLADIANVVGMLALFVPGGALLALVAAGIAVASTGLLAVYADGSMTDVALAAAGLATGGAAGLAGRAAAGARAKALGEEVTALPSLIDDLGETTAGEAGRYAKVLLDATSLNLGVAGYEGAIDRRYGRTPAPPPSLRLPSTVVSTQPGRRPAPRRIDEPRPARSAQRDRAASGAASGW